MAEHQEKPLRPEIGAAPPDEGVVRSRGRLLVLLLFAGTVAGFSILNIVALVKKGENDERFAPERWVNLEEREPVSVPSKSGPERPVLRVAIAPVISPEKSLGMYRGLVNYLAEQTGRSPVFMQRDTYLEVNDLVRFRRCDVAFVCTYAFIRGQREFGMEPLVVPQVGGVTSYHSFILVPADSNAESLLDLRDRRFASGDVLSNSGWLFPANLLIDRGEEPDAFFAEHVITGSHDRSVMAVASGFVDGAAVDSLVYDHMVEEDASIAANTRIIRKSPPFGMPPVVVPQGIDEALRDQLRDVLVGMHETARGRRILEEINIERFVVPPEGLFESVREAAAQFESNR